MKATLFGTVALLMLSTIACAADAGSGPTNGATSTKDAGSDPTPGAKLGTGSADSTGVTTSGQKTAVDAAKPDNAKAAGTGGGEGASAPTTTSNNGNVSSKVGARGAAATSQGAPGNENKPAATEAAGDGGGAGGKIKPEKTP